MDPTIQTRDNMPQRGRKTIILTAIGTVAFLALCSVVSVVGVVSGVFPDTLATRTVEEQHTLTYEADEALAATAESASATPTLSPGEPDEVFPSPTASSSSAPSPND
jgi:hypothetical protein